MSDRPPHDSDDRAHLPAREREAARSGADEEVLKRTTLIRATAAVVARDQELAEAPRSACLVVLSGLRFGELLRLGQRVVLGRENSDVCFPDTGVSRRHASLERRGDHHVLCDLASANGTWVNGVRIDAPRVLAEGDKIHLGPATLLRFATHDPVEEAFQRRMADAALRDPLTGAYNGRYFLRRLSSEISHARRHHRPLAVIVLDVDHLGTLNLARGHGAGDDVLLGLASVLERCIRGEDVLARIDADEFAVLARETGGDGARTLADRLRRAAAATALHTAAGPLQVTLCAGVASFPEVHTDSADRLLRAADAALFLARSRGPDTTAVHAPTRIGP